MNKSLLRKIKKGDGESAFQDVLREVAILKRLKHPNVVRMYEVMDDPENDNMFLVMEYVEGGQVLNMRGQRSETIFDEIKARKVCSVHIFLLLFSFAFLFLIDCALTMLPHVVHA